MAYSLYDIGKPGLTNINVVVSRCVHGWVQLVMAPACWIHLDPSDEKQLPSEGHGHECTLNIAIGCDFTFNDWT